MGPPPPSVDGLRALWFGKTTGPAHRRMVALSCLGLLVAALVARWGTPATRLVAVATAAGVLLATGLSLYRARRRRRSDRRLIEQTIARTEPALGAATLRAIDLTDRTTREPHRGSATLARLHLARLLGSASSERLVRHAGRVAWQQSGAALAVAAVCCLTVMLDPLRVVEGVDVAAASDGVAPLPLEWLERQRVVARPPAYLTARPRTLAPPTAASLPRGTEVSVIGQPRHEGRQLVLTDGRRQVPFVPDGRGGATAHWTLESDTTLTVAARFGEVLIPEPAGLELFAVADLPPVVHLDDAPTTVRLLDQPEVPLRYRAIDDHGLAEVTLVLRAGIREQRRSLDDLRGTSRSTHGALVLRMDDDFVEQSHLPIEVTIEARDDDTFSGPKWGRSHPIVIVPPAVGEREARRYAALEAVRDELVDLLAARVRKQRHVDRGPSSRADSSSQGSLQQAAMDRIEELLAAEFGGLRMSGTVRALVRGQLERLDRAVRALGRGPTATTEATLQRDTETAVLATDSMLAAVGDRDARAAARRLSEVATDGAAAIELSRQLDQRERADRRLDAALQVLEGGGTHLLKLGTLGRDLGEIVENGLRRIRRAWDAGDRYHAQLAAEDLAARLRVPDHSFGSAGGGGVEAGGPPRFGGEQASEAAGQAAGVDQALEQLRREHAAEVGSVERALEQAMRELGPDPLREELAKHAEAVRRAVGDLPRSGAESASPRAAAAAGRAHAEAMAGAIERGDLAEAVRRGRRAVETLEQAEQLGGGARPGSIDARFGSEASRAAGPVAQELAWAEQGLAKLRRMAAEQAGQQLDRSAQREGRLAERARRLHRESAASEAPLPERLLEHLEQAADEMEDASRQLRKRDGQQGLRTQRRAQRLLELAQPEQPEKPRSVPQPEGKGDQMAQDIDVPDERRNPRADRFRQRVTDGLRGEVPPHLREALQRYTEGLLR